MKYLAFLILVFGLAGCAHRPEPKPCACATDGVTSVFDCDCFWDEPE